MTYFQRWASTPSFRRWWPVVRPIYSVGFADFVKDRFNLRLKDGKAREVEKDFQGATLELSDDLITADRLVTGLACRQWIDRYGEQAIKDHKILEYRLKVEKLPRDGKGREPNWIQVGFLLFQELEGKIGVWYAPDLFVCHALIGAGIVARFLDRLIVWFAAKGFRKLKVVLSEQGRRSDPGTRESRFQDINFYKSRGFEYEPPDKNGQLRSLTLDLGH